MFYQKIAVLVVWLFCAGGSAVHASTIGLDPADSTVSAGELFSLNVVIDFSDDPTYGGGIDISWDSSVLQYMGWTFDNNTVWDDPAFRSSGTLSDGRLSDITAGDIGAGLNDGIYGTISFMALTVGATQVVTSAASDPDLIWAAVGSFEIQDPTFLAADVNVQAAVPVPAAVWLLLSACGLLLGTRRKR